MPNQSEIGILIPVDMVARKPFGGTSGFIESILPYFRMKVTVFGIGLGAKPLGEGQNLASGARFIPIAPLRHPTSIPLRLKSLIHFARLRNRILHSGVSLLYAQSHEVALPFLYGKDSLPLVFHHHGSINPVEKSKYKWARNPLLMAILDLLLAGIHKRADWIIAIDAPCLLQAKENGAGDKVTLLMNGVDTSLFRTDEVLRKDSRARLGLGSDEKAILFVGRLEDLKRVDRAIGAMELLRREKESGYRLIVAGDGTLRRRLERATLQKGLEKCVMFLGYVDRSRLPGLYNAADALILPSEIEGTPMVVLESLACGTPVVASNAGGIPSLVFDGVNGMLLGEASPENISSGLENILGKGLSRQAVSKTVQEHSAKKAVERLEAIFMNLIESGRHGL